MIQKLIEMLKRSNVVDLCDVMTINETCEEQCDECPFNHTKSFEMLINELEQKEIHGQNND